MKTVEVAAGVLRRADGRYLLAERPAHKHLGGYLEFPGGKLESGETQEAALARELEEELGIEVTRAEPLVQFEHGYPDYRVRAFLFRIISWRGEPRGCEGQRLVYAKPEELHTLPLLPANKPILHALDLPTTLMVTPRLGVSDAKDFLRRFERAMDQAGVGGAILRLKAPPNREQSSLPREIGLSIRRSGILTAMKRLPKSLSVDRGQRPLLQLNVGKAMEPSPGFTGLHLPAATLMALDARPPVSGWIGASVHNEAEAAKAKALGLDYAMAGSVRETPSHPGATPLGWEGFAAIARAAGIPIYAIGGMTPADVPEARRHWGQGIAAIRAFDPEHGL
jgi:8-oxo-dGTP diphosphatase